MNIVLRVIRAGHCEKYSDLMGESYMRLEKIA
jgi:hypothetical protein